MAQVKGFPELIETLKIELGSYRKVGNALGCSPNKVRRLEDGSGGLDRENPARLVFPGFSGLDEIVTGRRREIEPPTNSLGRALLIEDNAESGSSTQECPESMGLRTRRRKTYRDAVRALSGPAERDIVILDNRPPDGSGVLLLKNEELLRDRPSPPFLLITAYNEAAPFYSPTRAKRPISGKKAKRSATRNSAFTPTKTKARFLPRRCGRSLIPSA